MAEYIEREAAIAALNKVRDDQRVFKYTTASDFLSARDAIERAIKVLESLPAADVEPVQEWIPVKDRLPDAGGYVVCIAKRNPFSRFMPMVAIIKKNGWVNPITEQYISEVTHWMPLTMPQKEDER